MHQGVVALLVSGITAIFYQIAEDIELGIPCSELHWGPLISRFRVDEVPVVL